MTIFKNKAQQLNGIVTISGAKNSSLKLLCATLLTNETVSLKNMPIGIKDLKLQIDMQRVLGQKVLINEDNITVSYDKLNNELNWSDRSVRTSLLILGTLLTKTGYGKVPLPGGCKLGERKYDLHVKAMESLGAKVWENGEYLYAKSEKRLEGTDIYLDIRSTGATENSILMATLAKGRTRIWNPHLRPEIVDLIELLRKMGAKIEIRGQESIIIDGVNSLHKAKHTCIPDNVEALTWLVAGAITGGEIEINNFPFKHLEIPLIHLREAGLRYYISEDKNSLIVRKSELYPIDIATGPYPGINSDMQPIFAMYGLMAKGESKIIDLRFPGRYGYAEELKKMGANIEVKGDILILKGGNKLHGNKVRALDLRAGAALFIASLVADGETVIDNFEQVERGYDNIVGKLKGLK